MNLDNMIRIRGAEAQMMKDRGFILDAEDNIYLNAPDVPTREIKNDYVKRIQELHDANNTYTRDALNDKIYVNSSGDRWLIHHLFKTKGASVDTEDVKTIINMVVKNGPHWLLPEGSEPLTGVILVTEKTMTPPALETFNNFRSVPIQHFLADEFLIRVMQHYLQPEYTLIRRNEVKQRERNGLAVDKLPAMLASSPVARYYGARSGDMFIERTHAAFYPQQGQYHTTLRIVK